jgi:hypothetical protein
MYTVGRAIGIDARVDPDSDIEPNRNPPYAKRGWEAVCFTYANVEVRFIADNMAGPDQFNGFSIDAVSKPDPSCIALPASLQPVRVGGWLGIGESRTVVERRFKTPGNRARNQNTYHFSGTFPKCTVDYDGLTADLDVRYDASKVTHISGRQVTSC